MPNRLSPWVQYSSKDNIDIERAHLWENKRRFNQAASTPPMTEPLLSGLGTTGTGPLAQKVLQGESLHTPGIDPWARKLLADHLQEIYRGL